MISPDTPPPPSGHSPRKKWGKGKMIAGSIVAAAILLALMPEIAMLGFLLDAAVIEVLIIFTGIQCQIYWLCIKTTLFSGFSFIKKAWLRIFSKN